MEPVIEGARTIQLPGFARDFIAAHATLLKFLTIGTMGYVIYQFVVAVMYDTSLFSFLPDKDTSVDLLLFRHGDARFLIATLVATELSIVGVFNGHGRWTFRDRDFAHKPLWIRFAQFNAKALVSTLLIVTVIVNVLSVAFDLSHYLAVPIGVLVGFVWNWTWDTQIVWRRAKGHSAVSQ